MYSVSATKVLGVVAVALACCGCGGSSDSSPATASTSTLNGNAVMGPVNGATIRVFAISSTGTVSATALASTVTDANGNYSITIASADLPSGPVAIQMTGGTYREEGSGQTVNLSSKSFTALVPSITAGTTLNAPVGPLTDIAYQKFAAQMVSGLPAHFTLVDYINALNFQISVAFGIPDVVGTLPANPYGTISNDASGQYALVLAAISKAAQSLGTDSTALVAAYANSFISNGHFASVASSIANVTDALGLPVSFTPPSMASLATVLSQIAAGTVVLTGVTPPSGFSVTALNQSPPAVTPPYYHPYALPVSSTSSGSLTAVSCVVAVVAGSLTMNVTGLTQCTDYVGGSYTAAQLLVMCAAQGPACSFSTQACNIVNTTGYVGGCNDTTNGIIQRFYSGFTSGQATATCSAARPPCTSGT